jgi:hypothetical protein
VYFGSKNMVPLFLVQFGCKLPKKISLVMNNVQMGHLHRDVNHVARMSWMKLTPLAPFCGVRMTTNMSLWKLKAIFHPKIFGAAC